jgi:hypothetical protein
LSQGQGLKPSNGLEPLTPSLPWASPSPSRAPRCDRSAISSQIWSAEPPMRSGFLFRVPPGCPHARRPQRSMAPICLAAMNLIGPDVDRRHQALLGRGARRRSSRETAAALVGAEAKGRLRPAAAADDTAKRHPERTAAVIACAVPHKKASGGHNCGRALIPVWRRRRRFRSRPAGRMVEMCAGQRSGWG